MQELARRIESRKFRLLPFAIWLLIFYCTWLLIVAAGNFWATVAAHWPIAVAMAFGSYVAGSTPMGGGTVGFPVLVLMFDMPGSMGRNFGLAVQSIGMVSASIYILSAGQAIDWRLLKPAAMGTLIGTPLGAAFVAPFFPDLWVKLLFAVIWASFGIMHLIKLRELVAAHGSNDRWRSYDRTIGMILGLIGGVVAAITGVGIDMIIYATLVLLYRADLKISIPTSVLLMAITSVIGIAINIVLAKINGRLYPMDPEVFSNWLAAAPIVALGAPCGAWVVGLISRSGTLIFVSLLCVAQFFWTVLHERVSGPSLVISMLGIVVLNVIFHFLYQLGSEAEAAKTD